MGGCILAITGTRAEYGLLYPVLRRLEDNPAFDLRLLVTGMHLEERFGMTVREIIADGLRVDARVPLELTGDDDLDIALAMARGVEGMSRAMAELAPDAVLLLGDRFEILAAAAAAAAMRIPILHMEGGHVTEGAVDDVFRHAVTKLAHLHFTACEVYRQRIIQMGEEPGRVHAVGSTGIDNIMREQRMSREELSRSLGGFSLSRFMLVTFHPTTLELDMSEAEQAGSMLEALRVFDNLQILITAPNADAGNHAIHDLLRAFVEERPAQRLLVSSLGRQRYISALALAECVVGNSSSGIIEAPSLGVPTVNIGRRQQGRVRAESIIDVPPRAEAIVAGLRRALSDSFRQMAQKVRNPYGDGRASERIERILQDTDFRQLLQKRFHDISPHGAGL